MRIAVYHNLHSGGAKHSTYEIVRRLAGSHQVDLFTLNSADTDFFALRDVVHQTRVVEYQAGRIFGSPMGRLNNAVRLSDLRRLEAVSRQVAEIIDRGDYDVVYVHPCQVTQNPSVLCHLQTPALYHSREPLRRLYEPPIPRPYLNGASWRSILDQMDLLRLAYDARLQQIERRNIQKATRVVTNSYFTREALYRTYGVNARVVYHGVDLKTFRPLGLDREDLVITVGSLTPNKGFDFVIESLGRLPSALRPELVVVSNYQEVPERAYLQDLATRRGVRLSLRQMVSVDELVRLYNVARATLYAPVMEPFGLVPLESMACGTPVVAVAEGGVRESVTHGKTGLLAERLPQQFAEALRSLLEDPTLGARLGGYAREEALERWRWERTVMQIEAHLAELVNQNGTSEL